MLSLKEACKVVGVPYNSALYHYREGRIPVMHIAGRNLIEPETLRRVLAEVGYRKKGKRGPRQTPAT